MHKNLKEIETGWFVRDNETELVIDFAISYPNLRLLAHFNGFIPINSHTKFKSSNVNHWFDFTDDIFGETKPRFRGLAVFEDVLHVDIYSRLTYIFQVEDTESIYVGFHKAEDEQGRAKIILVADLSVVEVECHAVKFYASQIFD